MVLFKDRKDAGRLLAEKLRNFQRAKDTIVIAIPRGGVIVAHEVSHALGLPLDVTCPRKVGAPGNPEFALGAVTETGEAYLDSSLLERLGVSKTYIQEKISEETARAQERLSTFRKGFLPRSLKDKTTLLIDDGLATGSTMKAAIVSLRSEKVKTIVVAVPVSPPDTAAEIKPLADQFISLAIERNFFAVGQFYENFDAVSNDEVLSVMKLYHRGAL